MILQMLGLMIIIGTLGYILYTSFNIVTAIMFLGVMLVWIGSWFTKEES